jgi:hypothetical protein
MKVTLLNEIVLLLLLLVVVVVVVVVVVFTEFFNCVNLIFRSEVIFLFLNWFSEQSAIVVLRSTL